jgi:prepilin-type N-terminal cleavage/methylation domain-containing protein
MVIIETPCHRDKKMSGFSLIELVVTIGVAAILMGIATYAFNQLQKKSLAESEVRQLATDINDLRIRAMTTKQPQGITLNASNYILSAYTSTTGSYTTPIQQTAVATRKVVFPLVDNANVQFSSEMYEFDERGALSRKLKSGVVTSGSLGFTVFLGGDGTLGAVDCIAVNVLRSNVGKNSSGVCNAR